MQRHDTRHSNQPATGDLDKLVRRTAGETEHLRSEMRALRAEVQRLRAELDRRHVAHEVVPAVDAVELTAPGDEAGSLDAEPVQREAPVADGLSRRRLFGLLGGAAAAGAGLAVAGSALGADRADAADGDNFVIGAVNSNSNPGNATSLTGSTAAGVFMFQVSNSQANSGHCIEGIASSGTGVRGTSGPGFAVSGSATSGVGVAGGSGSGTGVFGGSSTGDSLVAGAPSSTSPGAHLLLAPAGGSGPPTGGFHQLGQFWMDSAGKLWQCVVAGTPGTWVKLSSPLVPVNPPARVYDSRNSGGPIASGQTRAVTVAGIMGVPAGIAAVLTNLTATGANAPGFLAMFAHGSPPPNTSNINLIPNQDLANNATSAVASNQVDVLCGGPVTSVNFIIDVFGYYP